MRALLASAFILLAAALHAQPQIILDLDKGYPEDQYYFLTYNAQSSIGLASNATGHDGKSARASWRIEVGEGGPGYTGFGYLHSIAAAPFPDLTGYTHLSLWYNNVQPADRPDRLALRFELHEREAETDPKGVRGTQVWVFETDAVLSTPTGWTELLVPLVAVADAGADGFAILPGEFEGDRVLDLDQIRHWAVVLVANGEPAGTVIEGTTLFDYLTAVSRPVAALPDPIPFQNGLLPGRPNPFSTTATLTYTLAAPASVSVRVFDTLGREVARLVEPQRLGAGRHEVELGGDGLAAGTYVCVLEIDGVRYAQLVTRSH